MISKISPALMKQVTILKSPFSPHKIYLIGTAHISKKSCESVKELVETVKPKIVFLEICHQRSHYLHGPTEETSFSDELSDLISGKMNLFAIMYSRLVTQAAKDLETPPGGEFKAAFDAADECGAWIVLGDRDVGITIQRVWKGLPFYDKCQLVVTLFGSLLYRTSNEDMKNMIEDLKDKEHIVLDVIIQMGEEIPWLIESILFERDLFMMNELVLTLDRIEGEEPQDIVAVVGAGHVPGIVQRWEMEMADPGSQRSAEKLRDISRIPGRISDDEHISKKDFRAYVLSRRGAILRRLGVMKEARAKLQAAFDARVEEVEAPSTPP